MSKGSGGGGRVVEVVILDMQIKLYPIPSVDWDRTKTESQ